MHEWNLPYKLFLWYQRSVGFLSRTCLWIPTNYHCHPIVQLPRTIWSNQLSDENATRDLVTWAEARKGIDFEWKFDFYVASYPVKELLWLPLSKFNVGNVYYAGVEDLPDWNQTYQSFLPTGASCVLGLAGPGYSLGRQIVAAIAHHQHRKLL